MPDPSLVRIARVRVAVQPAEPDEDVVDVAAEKDLARLREAVVAALPLAHEALDERETFCATDLD